MGIENGEDLLSQNLHFVHPPLEYSDDRIASIIINFAFHAT